MRSAEKILLAVTVDRGIKKLCQQKQMILLGEHWLTKNLFCR